ncbi:MAG: sulfotransferase family 2 domain-containing protein, partial [Flavobacteriales bacterium]
YRLPLGEYDYKRMLFAKHFLYSEEEFARMFKFTIVRNPYDRAVSCWKYLMKLYPSSVLLGRPRKLGMRMSFVRFLKELPRIWEEKEERHIATHTAPIWSDLTDEEGELLVDRIYRIEELDEALPELCDRLGVQKDRIQRKNVSRDRGDHRRYYSKKARKWVEQLYGQDIERVGYEF